MHFSWLCLTIGPIHFYYLDACLTREIKMNEQDDQTIVIHWFVRGWKAMSNIFFKVQPTDMKTPSDRFNFYGRFLRALFGQRCYSWWLCLTIRSIQLSSPPLIKFLNFWSQSEWAGWLDNCYPLILPIG